MTSPTETIITAMRILAAEIHSEDGIANAAIAEAAERLGEQAERIAELEAERDEAVRAWGLERNRIAELEQQRAVVPEGWRLVPVEPTERMIMAARRVETDWISRTVRGTSHPFGGIYEAMLAASPAPKAQAHSDTLWHDAILNECMLIEGAYQPDNPTETLRLLLDWHSRVGSVQPAEVEPWADQISLDGAAGYSGRRKPAEVGADEREAFEAWFSDNWEHPKAVERDAVGYKLGTAQNAWTTWQTAWKQARAQLTEGAVVVGYANRRKDGSYGSWLFPTRESAERFDSTAANGYPAGSEVVALTAVGGREEWRDHVEQALDLLNKGFGRAYIRKSLEAALAAPQPAQEQKQ